LMPTGAAGVILIVCGDRRGSVPGAPVSHFLFPIG
jgi:hypothetical protein